MTGDMASILLPAGRVDFFTLNEGTSGTAAELSADWRFARVAVNLLPGGIDTAIAKYAAEASPELIVIETDDIGENFVAQLGALAGVCAPGTDAVVIGPTNDVHLYRSLVGMGVRDYLVRPVNVDDLSKITADVIVEKRGLSGSRLIAITGAKGGVGATTLSQIIAWNAAQALGQKTTLLDAAGTGGSLGISYGLEPATSLTEAVRIGASGSDDDMKRIIQHVSDNLSILICGGEPLLADVPDPDGVEGLVNRLLQKTPVVVMDLSGTSAAVQKRILSRASHVVVATTPLLSALRNARTLLSEIRHIRGGAKDVDLVITMQGAAGGEEVPLSEIKKALDIEPAGRIPYAPKVFSGSEASGHHVGVNKGAQEIVSSLLSLSARATGAGAISASAAGGKGKAGIFDFLKKGKA